MLDFRDKPPITAVITRTAVVPHHKNIARRHMHHLAFSAIIAAIIIISTFDTRISDFFTVNINGPVLDLDGLRHPRRSGV